MKTKQIKKYLLHPGTKLQYVSEKTGITRTQLSRVANGHTKSMTEASASKIEALIKDEIQLLTQLTNESKAKKTDAE